MKNWVTQGLATGIVSTPYPRDAERTPGTSPGLPSADITGANADAGLPARCPTSALSVSDGRMGMDRSRCVHCFRCVRGVDKPAAWEEGFEWAEQRGQTAPLPDALRGSLHIRVIDAGDCGACLNETKLLNNPYYNMHRLGFFITPTPRQADILLVVGPVTDHMRSPLLKAYEAMAEPKRVMAVGACALSGGVVGPNFVTGAGVAELLPVDVAVPGCPPPPLAILHGLLVLAGRKIADQSTGPVSAQAREEGGAR